MVSISKEIYALKEIFNLTFSKYPLANAYHNYPFLLFENVVDKEQCQEIINSLENESFQARLIQKGLDESIRKTILHKPTPFIEHFFSSVIQSKQKEIGEFFHISLLKGSAIQILEYLPGGFYKRHADNASELIKDNRVVGYKEQRKERKLTTLLFLNDDFSGGEIEFSHLRYKSGKRVIFKPRAASLLVFPSHGLFAHEVHPVKKAKRYAIVKWWDVL